MAQPLTKHHRNGKRYERPPDIERLLDLALKLAGIELKKRVAIPDRDDPGFLSSECLVHLMRDARKRKDQNTMDFIMPCLLSRCEETLRTKVPDTKYKDAANLRDEILQEFAALFAVDGTAQDKHQQLDFFECKFNLAFATFRRDAVSRERTEGKLFPGMPAFVEQEDSVSDDATFSKLAKVLGQPATHEHRLLLAELNHAIDTLPPDERQAAVLHWRVGYEIESENPDKLTVAKLCNVTGKTIYNRLKRAAQKLSRFKEEA